MTAANLPEVSCLLVTLLVLGLSAAGVWGSAALHARPRVRLHGLCVAWCVICCFPPAMIVGYVDAVWPYDNNGRYVGGPFRWGLVVRDGAAGLLAAFVLGNALAFVAFWHRKTTQGPWRWAMRGAKIGAVIAGTALLSAVVGGDVPGVFGGLVCLAAVAVPVGLALGALFGGHVPGPEEARRVPGAVLDGLDVSRFTAPNKSPLAPPLPSEGLWRADDVEGLQHRP